MRGSSMWKPWAGEGEGAAVAETDAEEGFEEEEGC